MRFLFCYNKQINAARSFEESMEKTTLCYLEKDEQYLMLHRVKKENDVNKDKWIGLGGHLEAGETPEMCLLREIREETGLTLTHWRFCGEVYFSCPPYPEECMYLFHADGFTGTLLDCDEGELAWLEKSRLKALPAWEGDFIFLELMERHLPPFTLTLKYARDGKLLQAQLDDTPLPLPDWRSALPGACCF